MSKRQAVKHAYAPAGTGSGPGVPAGYKRTELGVIPEDWAPKTLLEVAPLQRGFDLPTSRIRTGPHPVVYSNGVLRHHCHAMVQGPGVVTGRSGTIGKVHFVANDYWPHNTALWVVSFRGNDPKFIYYLYAHIDFARFLSGSGVPTLNRNDVHPYLIPMPSPAEQRAIASVLSDIDELIESLESLIDKKRAIKQSAMQQLLTGRTRLPGFGGDWEVFELGTFVRIRNAKIQSVEVSGDTPCVELEHIGQGMERRARHHQSSIALSPGTFSSDVCGRTFESGGTLTVRESAQPRFGLWWPPLKQVIALTFTISFRPTDS